MEILQTSRDDSGLLHGGALLRFSTTLTGWEVRPQTGRTLLLRPAL
jgi:hypothetical protein